MTSWTDTPSSIAMNARNRAASRTPAIPMTRSRGKPAASNATWHIASSGLETTMMTAFGDPLTTCSVTDCTIPMLVFSRSSRLIPGLRAMPEVITTTSDPAVSS